MSPPLMLGMTVLPTFFLPDTNIYTQVLANVMEKEKVREMAKNALLLLLIAITSEIRNLTVEVPRKASDE